MLGLISEQPDTAAAPLPSRGEERSWRKKTLLEMCQRQGDEIAAGETEGLLQAGGGGGRVVGDSPPEESDQRPE